MESPSRVPFQNLQELHALSSEQSASVEKFPTVRDRDTANCLSSQHCQDPPRIRFALESHRTSALEPQGASQVVGAHEPSHLHCNCFVSAHESQNVIADLISSERFFIQNNVISQDVRPARAVVVVVVQPTARDEFSSLHQNVVLKLI